MTTSSQRSTDGHWVSKKFQVSIEARPWDFVRCGSLFLMSENQSTTKRMTRVLSSIILVLLLQGSIAHEYRVQSSVVVNRRAELPIKPSLLRSPPSSVLSPLLQLRGGSDYYDRSNDSSYGSYDDRSSGREDRNRRYEDRSDGDLYDSSPRRDNTDDRYNERDDYDDRGSRVRSFREI